MSDTRNGTNETNVGAYIETSMRARLDDVQDLIKLAGGDEGHEITDDRAAALGLDPDGDLPGMFRESAESALTEYPARVEVTITFEVVLGFGTDDRLLIECDVADDGIAGRPTLDGCRFEIRRVLYRLSKWSAGSEVVLTGEDREAAEELARRVVPELVE
jgi:hypothetical protein